MADAYVGGCGGCGSVCDCDAGCGSGITFVEKPSFKGSSAFMGCNAPAGHNTLIPVFMVKDGIEYFVINRRESEVAVAYKTAELDAIKAALISNGGRYFKFNGAFGDPLEMVRDIERRGYGFRNPGDLFWVCDGEGYGAGFVDFHGNLNELSAAFHYRIFDRAFYGCVKTAVREILPPK